MQKMTVLVPDDQWDKFLEKVKAIGGVELVEVEKIDSTEEIENSETACG